MELQEDHEKNIKIVQTFFQEVLVNRRMELYDELFEDEYIFGYLGDQARLIDHETNKSLILKLPAYTEFETLEIVAQNNKVVIFSKITVRIDDLQTRSVVSEFITKEDIGRTSTFVNVSIFKFKNHKISKGSRIFDRYNYYRDLGLLDRMVEKQTHQSCIEYVDQLRKDGIVE